jgi:RluA family pseudouridine synthase
MLTYQISAPNHIRRIDSFLQNLMPAAPPSYLRKLMKGGNIIVNGGVCSSGTILLLSDTVSIKETTKTVNFLANRLSAPDILFEDDRIIIFNKPAGIPVHRSAEHGGENLMEHAVLYFQARDNRTIKLCPVNRLDKGTSGAVITARSSAIAGVFGKLFQEGLVEKRYLAFIAGRMHEEGVIDYPLDGKEAFTAFQTLFQGDKAALLVVRPLTGRTHQIRRHFALTDHPLIADKRYGGKSLRGFNREVLHALKLSFQDPFTGDDRTIFAPPSTGFLQNMATLAGNSYISLLNALKEM